MDGVKSKQEKQEKLKFGDGEDVIKLVFTANTVDKILIFKPVSQYFTLLTEQTADGTSTPMSTDYSVIGESCRTCNPTSTGCFILNWDDNYTIKHKNVIIAQTETPHEQLIFSNDVSKSLCKEKVG